MTSARDSVRVISVENTRNTSVGTSGLPAPTGMAGRRGGVATMRAAISSTLGSGRGSSTSDAHEEGALASERSQSEENESSSTTPACPARARLRAW
eukprot:9472503-Pyramimonas_sp.AAC.1